MPIHRPPADATVQHALGIRTIGDGYILGAGGIAVALVELTPPDLAALDTTTLAAWLDTYMAVLRANGDRCSLHTFAVPPDVRPLLGALTAARDRAPDATSFLVLHALADVLTQALPALAQVPTVRWVLAVPSAAPESLPRGTWGALAPGQMAPRAAALPGDPVQHVLTRARRLLGAFATLDSEPAPRLLPAHAIRALLRLALDPVATLAHPDSFPDEVRPLQVASWAPQGGA